MSAKHPVLLTLDGGGVRGLLTAYWLAEIERRLGQPLLSTVDMFVGVSTGSILAAALSHGVPASKLPDIYCCNFKSVFPHLLHRLISRVKRLRTNGFSMPKYDGVGLRTMLEMTFGNVRLSDTQADLVISTYNVSTTLPMTMTSYDPKFEDEPLVDVIMGSCAAPGTFPAVRISTGDVLMDGSIISSNPVLVGISEACARYNCNPADLTIISLGTGVCERTMMKDTEQWGVLQWITSILTLLLDGSMDAGDQIASKLVSTYIRYDIKLPKSLHAIDNTKLENVNNIVYYAKKSILDDQCQFDLIVDMLNNR